MKRKIKVKELEIPTSLGSGQQSNLEKWFCKCSVIQSLYESGEISQTDIYCDNDKVKSIISTLSDEKKELFCKNSPLCGDLINKMLKGEYIYNDSSNINANIEVSYNTDTGMYRPYEGKHRACCAKNFLQPEDTIFVDDRTGK